MTVIFWTSNCSLIFYTQLFCNAILFCNKTAKPFPHKVVATKRIDIAN